jgi:hypothetical protein
MATKHHIVGNPNRLSKEQLAQLESDYERDLALAPKDPPKESTSKSKSPVKDDKKDDGKKSGDTGQ